MNAKKLNAIQWKGDIKALETFLGGTHKWEWHQIKHSQDIRIRIDPVTWLSVGIDEWLVRNDDGTLSVVSNPVKAASVEREEDKS